RFGPEEVARLKSDLKSGAAGQLQQLPAPESGDLFKRYWWQYWKPVDSKVSPVAVKGADGAPLSTEATELPERFEQVIHSWDMQFKETGSSYTVGHVWGRLGANFYLIDQVRGRMDFVQSLAAVRKMVRDYPAQEKLIEAKANGPAIISALRDEIPGIIAVEPDGGKVARANSVVSYVESKNVFLPHPSLYDWVTGFIEELAAFPNGRNDDQVDCASQALRRLADSVALSAAPEFRVTPRKGEPNTACHVERESVMQIAPWWRRYIAVAPGARGAAIWFCETPS